MSTDTAIKCPRCQQPLASLDAESGVHCCPSCDGALVTQSALQPLLKKLAADLKDADCLHDGELRIADKGAGLACPQCGSAMENYGYLGTNKVQIDGCAKCWIVWTDAEELAAMASIHARSLMSKDEIQKLAKKLDSEAAHFRSVQRIRRSFRRLH